MSSLSSEFARSATRRRKLFGCTLQPKVLRGQRFRGRQGREYRSKLTPVVTIGRGLICRHIGIAGDIRIEHDFFFVERLVKRIGGPLKMQLDFRTDCTGRLEFLFAGGRESPRDETNGSTAASSPTVRNARPEAGRRKTRRPIRRIQ